MGNILQILSSYDFLIVAAGTVLLAIPAAMIGCLSVYKGQSLMADAIGHASYPGIVIAFMLLVTRNPIVLTVGAALSGVVAYVFIQMITKHSIIDFDASLAIVLTGFFGLGMVLKSYVQGHPAYVHASQAGLKNYIFGSAAFMMKEDIILILVCAAIAMTLFFLFKKELTVSIFDPEFARAIGIHPTVANTILLCMMILFIVIGLKCIGAILISSFLVMPCIFADQLSKKLNNILVLASVMAAIAAFTGTFLSTLLTGISTGPMIIVCMGIMTAAAMIFGKYGLISRTKRRSDTDHA